VKWDSAPNMASLQRNWRLALIFLGALISGKLDMLLHPACPKVVRRCQTVIPRHNAALTRTATNVFIISNSDQCVYHLLKWFPPLTFTIHSQSLIRVIYIYMYFRASSMGGYELVSDHSYNPRIQPTCIEDESGHQPVRIPLLADPPSIWQCHCRKIAEANITKFLSTEKKMAKLC
jgi:hypothetical protein